MESIIAWIVDNKQWLFEGGGVALLTGLVFLIRMLFKKKSKSDRTFQKQQSGKNSTNIQVGHDLIVSAEKLSKKE
jgi:predicted tellurium resistance membrane protein TerC